MPSITEACLPRIASVDSSCGCTLTKATILGLTPATFEAMGKTEYAMAQMIANSAEAKALGVREKPLTMLLKSNLRNITPFKGNANISAQSIPMPYIMRQQSSVVNSNYFAITAGAATTGAGTGDIPASAWNITVKCGASWASPLYDIKRYFLPGKTIIILSNDTDGTARTLLYTIYAVVDATSGGVEKAKITLIPNVTATGWAALDAGEKAVYRRTAGVAQVGANNVSNWESWCYNQPSENPRKLIVNWLQRIRTSRCVDDQYKDMLAKVLAGQVNPFMQKFSAYIPLAEQNKQAIQLDEAEFLRTVWYGQPINEKQTPETYRDLPTVTDPEDNSCVVEYKANTLGVEYQLDTCNRVIDMGGARLNFDTIFELLYTLKRTRGQDGDNIQVVDCFTDRHTSAVIYEMMVKYLKDKYQVSTTRYIDIGKKLTLDGMVDLTYNLYDIPEAKVQLAVFTEDFFDDHLAQFEGAQKSRGRNLWFIDWSDIGIGVGDVKKVTRRSPSIETSALYKCRMQGNQKEYTMQSSQITVMVDRPHRHLLIHNFSNECPTLTSTSCAS